MMPRSIGLDAGRWRGDSRRQVATDLEPEWPYPVSEFQCHRCGNCCRGDGDVALTADDCVRLAAALGVTEAVFAARYTRGREDGAICLIDQGDALRSCVFLTAENTCQVHAVKPTQCQGFPMKWRPTDALEICAGLRAAAGLPYPTRRTMNRRTG